MILEIIDTWQGWVENPKGLTSIVTSKQNQ